MASDYLYEPLPTSQLHIRLCRLLPGLDNQPPIVELQTFKWSEVEGTYDALSYMWGSPDGLHRISAGDAFVEIRDNLWRFLLHYKKTAIPDKSRYIWIDSLCINQADLAEKSIQVAAMGSIFRGARRVLVWLGEASEHVTLTQADIDHVQQVYSSFEWSYGVDANDAGYSREDYFRQHMTVSQCFTETWRPTTEDEAASHRRLQAYLQRICAHPYWSRLWIVQEVHLARNGPQIIAGSLILTDEFLGVMKEAALLYGKDPSETLAEASQKQDSFMKLMGRNNQLNFDASYVDGATDSLVSILHRYCLQSCFESRDRIFGLLGMLNSSLPTARIKVDYQIERWLLFLIVLDLILAERESNELDKKKPVLSWVRWSAWALDIDSADIATLLNNACIDKQASVDFECLSLQFRRYIEDHNIRLMTAKTASRAFASCVFDITVSSPHTRMYTQSNQEMQSVICQTLTKETAGSGSVESYNYRFRSWLQGRFQSYWKHRTQTWVCQLDEEYCFPLAVQPQSTGFIRVLGYVAREQAGDNKSPWKLNPFPPELSDHFQAWFDKHLSEIKQQWLQPSYLQKDSLRISMSILQMIQLAELSRKMVAHSSYAEDLLQLDGSPSGVPI